MKAVRILAPAGSTLAVFEVVVESEGGLVSFIRAPGGGKPREVRGRYASIKEALARNSRSTTTAERLDVADIQEARAMVEA